MANTYLPNDYLYLSARMRAKEMGIVGKERLVRLTAMSYEEICATLSSEGVWPAGATREEALAAMLREAFALLSDAPDPTVFAFLRYSYDCHNLKTALKCHVLSRDPAPLYLDVGTVPISELDVLPASVPPSLPAHMREAVETAYNAFLQNNDPREIDFLLDAACFADMVESCRLPLARELVRARAEMTNLRTCRRLLAMQAGELGERMLSRAFLAGGESSLDTLLALYREGEEKLREYVAKGAYAALFATDDPAAIDRAADDHYLTLARKGARVPFGAEVVIGYLVGVEYAVKNLRILLVAKEAGEDAETLTGRLRESYV